MEQTRLKLSFCFSNKLSLQLRQKLDETFLSRRLSPDMNKLVRFPLPASNVSFKTSASVEQPYLQQMKNRVKNLICRNAPAYSSQVLSDGSLLSSQPSITSTESKLLLSLARRQKTSIPINGATTSCRMTFCIMTSTRMVCNRVGLSRVAFSIIKSSRMTRIIYQNDPQQDGI